MKKNILKSTVVTTLLFISLSSFAERGACYILSYHTHESPHTYDGRTEVWTRETIRTVNCYPYSTEGECHELARSIGRAPNVTYIEVVDWKEGQGC